MGVVLDRHIIILKPKRILNPPTNHNLIAHRHLRLLIHLNNQHQRALSNQFYCFAIVVLNVKNIYRLSLLGISFSLRNVLLVATNMFRLLQACCHSNVNVSSKGQEHMRHPLLDGFAFQ